MEEPNRNTDGDGDGDASEARGVSEEAVDPSVTEDINDDDMDSMSSTSSDSPRSNKINWDEIFNRKNKSKKKQKKAPKQMIQKKRCGARKRPREQKASTVIYPMSDVERVYEAEFKVKAHRMMALPKRYDVAAQITLENGSSNCHAEPRQDLINITLEEMPNVQLQDLMDKHSNIIKPYVVPEPCQKHPYQIILPYENGLSMLPVTDVHRELASFAAFNGTHIIASENALKCLSQWNRHWLIPFSICATVKPDGTIKNVLVLDSEFSVHRETAPMRTYKAFRHMLEQALITLTERERVAEIHRQVKSETVGSSLFVNTGEDVEMAAGIENLQISPDMLYVFGSPETEFGTPEAVLVRPNASFVPQNTRFVSPISKFGAPSTTSGEPQGEQSMSGETEGNPPPTADLSEQEDASCLAEATSKKISGEGLAVPGLRLCSCSCTDSVRRRPPLRSFRRWQFRREGNSERHDFIVHCPHKCKDETGELILEPIPEYQSEKGKSEQSHDSVRSTALSLTLRKHAYLVNVRINGRTGEVANYEKLSSKTFVKKYPDVKRQVINSILAVFSQLEQLKPGPYLLQHEPSHGPNAMIMCPQVMRKKHTLLLNFDRELKEMSKVQVVKIPPTPAFLQASTSRD